MTKKPVSFVTGDGFTIGKSNMLKGSSFSAKGRPVYDTPQDKNKSTFTTHFYQVKEHLTDQVLLKSNVSRVGIIGGGVAGIVTARILLDEGIDVTLYETTGQLAGVWAENYVGFGIQVPANLYEFPDEPLPDTWDFGAGNMIGQYIQQYAQKHGVYHVAQLNTRVQEIQGDGSSGYKLVLEKEGKKSTEEFDLVIVATGVYGKQDKFVPDWNGKSKFKGEIIHCADFFDLDKTENKHVLTVGFGKSAFDCAQISAQQAKSSTMLFREAHWCVPRKILGLVPFEYATFSRFGAACLQPAYIASGPFERILHGIPGFLSGFWWLVGTIFKTQFWLPRSCIPNKGFIADFWGGHGIIPNPAFFGLVRSGKINPQVGQIKEIKETSVVLASGEEKPCDLIIAATGYKPVRSFLPQALKDLKEKDGLWLYRNMIHPDHPKLIFLNSEITTFTNITTPSIQARWLVEMLAGNHEMPSKDAMQASIKETQAWKRKVMPNAGPSRASMIQTHQLHYYDQLLKDMGASIRRKSGNSFTRAVKEIFDPYRPGDFHSIVTGEYKYRPDEMVTSKQSSFLSEGVRFLAGAGFLVLVGDVFKAGCKEKLGQVKVADLWSSDNFSLAATGLSSLMSQAGKIDFLRQFLQR